MASALLQRLTIVVPTKEGRTARKELFTLYFLELLVSGDQHVTFLTALSQAAQHNSPLPGFKVPAKSRRWHRCVHIQQSLLTGLSFPRGVQSVLG